MAESKIAQLIDRWYATFPDDRLELRRAIAAFTEAQIAAAVEKRTEALSPYLSHWSSCTFQRFKPWECGCGLLQIASRAAGKEQG